MSDDPFGDLDAAMGDSGPSTPDSEADATQEQTTETDELPETEQEVSERSPLEDPAFEFDETVHKALYVLEAVAAEFDDIITYDVERELTRDHGLKNVKKSELHNAALAVIAEHPDLIVDRVLEQRGIDDE
ncbi:hypothetical protein GJR96_16735 [Haloferax sp. MBLA0076]|uniref:Uncharacterized protein n=1 Tax=Haloferax litoreum TaxID=2666140 RepID=A0A6A8GM10_9EURY|nr:MULTISPECIES: hypothetical protein [Haloferax]KAB1190600.1 hypothetical protein Hfx1148_16680 [Haloferax sp. CBA1148]MRX23592.1 hypothetical protein [Haloferax litoreum]